MAEKEIESIIRDFVDALEKKDMDIVLSFFTDNATWVTTEGTFKVKEEIKKYLAWDFKSLTEVKVIDNGVRIIIQSNKAAYQNIFDFT